MNFLKPSELRNTLNISRSTEHRLLKNGMSAIGVGRLRRYDQEAAIEWFRTHGTDTSRNLLAPGDFRCSQCGFAGTLQKAIVSTQMAPCPNCRTRDIPIRVDSFEFPGDTKQQLS
ncbi:MAG: helix-turn-helix domain-containing protein [Nitrospirales bacterium]|nr:helix-turn-helix domain-containing protein [Nitrospirales bacterium]